MGSPREYYKIFRNCLSASIKIPKSQLDQKVIKNKELQAGGFLQSHHLLPVATPSSTCSSPPHQLAGRRVELGA